MKNKNILLLKTLLLSTSWRNILKYSKDKKKKKQMIGGIVGMTIIFAMIMAYSIMMCIGYGEIGITDAIPGMCAVMISAIAFLFTLFKTNGYLFNFKEYDMLMSLPFEAKTIAGDKFLYMYVKSLPWYVSISVSMMIGYGLYAKTSALVYPVWIILTLVLPIIPMLVAAFIGFLIAKVSSGFKKTNIVQTILVFIFVIFCFSLRFIIEGIFKNDQVEVVLETVSDVTGTIGSFYWPVKWFAGAVNGFHIGDMFLLVGVSVILFELIFIPGGKSYREINSKLKSHGASKAYKMTAQKKRNLVNTIAFKEFKRLMGSTVYMTNVLMGELLAFLVGVIALFVGVDNLIATVLQGAPISKEMLYPAIPLIVYFFIGMVPTTACSPSLEGKNFWIVQSLPINKKVLYRGKMLFNMYLTIPFSVFSTLCLCISAKTPVVNTVLYLMEGIAL
ncbi:MAG: hypothetical protein PUB19_08615, partial [Lachnospiraceae bacterium]|nr:hypothetical protein [Lachnospiraceae bacterium]